MSKSVQTTKIEKKYKDKKTGEWKSITINYAKVADRLHEFRQDNPRSKISTTYKEDSEGHVVFKAYVWKDKTDFLEALKVTDASTALLSADSEGSAKSQSDGEKDFEKLETIAVGRALALLGYAVTGEIASSEEMEAFEAFKLEKFEAEINEADKVDTLMNIFNKMNAEEKKTFTPLLAEKKKELTHADTK